MEQLPENNTAQDNPSEAIPQTSLGTLLREAREQLGLSVSDVAAQTKFAPRQIEALEADDFKNLPETAFLRGFVRSYAKILNVDAEVLLAALPQPKAPAAELIPASVDVPFPKDYSAQKNLLMLVAALLLALIVAGFVVWHFTAPLKQKPKVEKIETPISLPAEVQIVPAPPVSHETKVPDKPKRRAPAKMEQPSPRAEQAATELSAPKIQSASAVSATHHTGTMKKASIHLVFDEESWTEITDGDGAMLSSQINQPGSELNLKGYLPLSLVIGHASATRLYRDGQLIDLAPYTNSSSEVARITLE
jgi:cytoskeleton protein RodZ